MKITKFEDIIAWKKGKELVILVYRHFQSCNDYGFKNQIQRASISITNNIAEGFERKTNKELINYLYIAKGSAAEVRSMLSIGKELNYFSEKQFDSLYLLSLEILKLLSGFIKTL